MIGARAHIAVAIAAIGVLFAVDTLLLLYLGRGLFPSQDVLSLTTGFVVLQEVMLFGVLVYIAMTAGQASVALPIHLGYISVLVSCSLFALLVIAVFDVLLTWGLIGMKAYWTALAMRQTSLVIFLLGIHIVGIVQRASHRVAEQQRAATEDVVGRCHRISESARLAGWTSGRAINRVADQFRFSEALRRDEAFRGEVLARILELDTLARAKGDENVKMKADRLLNELLILSQRQS